ncbi:MAG: glycosyltransferase [Ignavibacteriae bacterium]|nr:glycosyltransferase [Ignavibacteriota bacterium]
MKIIIVSTAYPLRGGIAHFNALLAKHLRVRHEVETITFKRQYPKFLFPGKTQVEDSTRRDESSGNTGLEEIQPAPQLVDSINPLNWLSVASEIKKRKPDLVIFKYWLPFFGPCFGTIAKRVKRGTKTKVLFICDNIIPHERRPGDVAFTKYAFKAADYFIVQSKSVEKDLNTHFPNSSYRLVPHPVYENFGKLIPQEEARAILNIKQKHVLLFFGYVRHYKGLDTLIEAFKLLTTHYSPFTNHQLLVVGEFYDDEQKYRQQVKELNLESSVRFVSEYVPNGEVANCFSASDVVVLPYRSATQSGIVQIAYNFDKPVIATDVGGLSETVLHERTGYIVPPEHPRALADAIIKYFEEDKQEVFSRNVREEKKKYSWEHFVGTIEELAGGH